MYSAPTNEHSCHFLHPCNNNMIQHQASTQLLLKFVQQCSCIWHPLQHWFLLLRWLLCVCEQQLQLKLFTQYHNCV